jgi:transketolase
MSHFKESFVFHPGSPVEMNALFKQCYSNGKINFFRLTEYPHGILFSSDLIEVGKGILIKSGRQVTLATIGAQLKNAVEAGLLLSNRGIDAEIIYFPTIKPIDIELLRSSTSKTKRLLVVEEASAHDGFFNQALRATISIPGICYGHLAIEDFIHTYGTYEELCEHTGLTSQGIVKKVETMFAELLQVELCQKS